MLWPLCGKAAGQHSSTVQLYFKIAKKIKSILYHCNCHFKRASYDQLHGVKLIVPYSLANHLFSMKYAWFSFACLLNLPSGVIVCVFMFFIPYYLSVSLRWTKHMVRLYPGSCLVIVGGYAPARLRPCGDNSYRHWI